MPNKKNAMKALRAATTKRQINLRRTKKVKEAVKTLAKAVEAKDVATAKTAVKAVAKTVDKAAAKKVIHKNKASRLRSRAQKKANKLEAK
jgi:small subunit ribosomal protein S20